MNHTAHNRLVSFIWTIADDCLRDVYVRGKYRDVILPMVVLRRLDTLLEPTKEEILKEVSFQQNEMKAIELDDAPLKEASGYVFFNTSKWTLKQLHATATNNQQILLTNVEEYLNGFSENVKEDATPQCSDSFRRKLSYSLLLLIGLGFVFSQPVDHGGRLAAKGGMWAFAVVELDPLADARLCV